MLPGTLVGLLIVVLAVLPGFVYQVTLRGWRGPQTDENDVNIRVLRGIAGSVVLAVAYVLVLGRALVEAVSDDNMLLTRPRQVALGALLLVAFIPWLLATGRYFVATSRRWEAWSKRLPVEGHLLRAHSRSPSAWDHAFEKNRSTGWVRAITTDGQYIGGWRGKGSLSSAYPQPHDLYLEISYRMNPDGSFSDEIAAPNGIWIRCDDLRAIEFLPHESQ